MILLHGYHFRNKIKVMPRATVCEDSIIRGDVTISSGTVVHPSSTIIAESGPIIIGENCIIEEYAKIIHRIPSDHKLVQENTDKPHVLVIGANNIFEVGCTVEALKIGEKNVFECRSYVSSGVTISSGCVIGAGCSLNGNQHLKENTVIYGKNCQQREALDKQGVSEYVLLTHLMLIFNTFHSLMCCNWIFLERYCPIIITLESQSILREFPIQQLNKNTKREKLQISSKKKNVQHFTFYFNHVLILFISHLM